MVKKKKNWWEEDNEAVTPQEEGTAVAVEDDKKETPKKEPQESPRPDITSPKEHVIELRIVPMGGIGAQGQQTVVVGPPTVSTETTEEQKRDYLENLEKWIATNTAMLLSTREAIRTELLKQDLGFFESIDDYPTVEERRKRYPLEDDFIFDRVREVLDDWKKGRCSLEEAYTDVRYVIEHPDEVKALANGEKEEEEDEED